MNLKFLARGISTNPALEAYVTRRLYFAVGRFLNHLRTVRVTLSDENGPRGGADKRCKLFLGLGRRGSLVVEDTATSVRAAVDNASERAHRAVARLVRRHLDRKRERLS